MAQLLPSVASHLPITIGITLGGALIALLLGVVLAWVKFLETPFVKHLTSGYVYFFRSTPLLVQLFLFYYGLPQIFPILAGATAFQVVTIGLGLHYAAYVAEVLRGAFMGVDQSQTEAALSVGMTPLQSVLHITLPQAFRIALPGLMNNLIDLLKSTSLAFTLGVTEMVASAKMEAASSFKFFESYVVLALLFAILVMLLTVFQQKLETHISGKA